VFSQMRRTKTGGVNSSNRSKSNITTANNSSSSSRNNSIRNNYDGFPLVQALMATEAKRTASLTKEGAKQMTHPKSNTGWIRSLFVFEGRALDRILLPWTIVTLNAVAWAVVYEETDFRIFNYGDDDGRASSPKMDDIEGVLELVLTTTMAFLLVFRLNRSATRFWLARGSWGVIVVRSRSMVAAILRHGSHDPHHRDAAVRWIAAFSIAAMNHARGLRIDPDTVEGILGADELVDLNGAVHPPLHAADRIRYHLTEIFGPGTHLAAEKSASAAAAPAAQSHLDAARVIALANFRTQQLVALEQQLNVLIDEHGVLERIKGTPLPMVYVTHLRTWLMLFLLILPFFWEETLGYGIVPVECLAAFALLGLEGAAAEVEAPFRKDRTNHLDMDTFCLAVLAGILQQTQDDARRRKAAKEIKEA